MQEVLTGNMVDDMTGLVVLRGRCQAVSSSVYLFLDGKEFLQRSRIAICTVYKISSKEQQWEH